MFSFYFLWYLSSTFLVNTIQSKPFDAKDIWMVTPNHIDIEDYTESFRLNISSISHTFTKEDYFIISFGKTENMWSTEKIFPGKLLPKDFNREIGQDPLSLMIDGTDNKKCITFVMIFNKAFGYTLMVKAGPLDEILFIDTLQLLDEPSLPKISIISGNVEEAAENSAIRVQCSATRLGSPPGVLKLEIPDLKETSLDHSAPNIVMKTYFVTADDDNKPIECSLGKKTVTYKKKLNVLFGPREPIISNPLGSSDVVNPGEFLECLSNAKPPAKYVWVPAHDSDLIDTPIVIQNNKLLVMDNRYRGHRRHSVFQYTCVAFNQLPGKRDNLTNTKTVTFLVTNPKASQNTGIDLNIESVTESTVTSFLLAIVLIIAICGIMLFIIRWPLVMGYDEYTSFKTSCFPEPMAAIEKYSAMIKMFFTIQIAKIRAKIKC